jgi:hypothetical protein
MMTPDDSGRPLPPFLQRDYPYRETERQRNPGLCHAGIFVFCCIAITISGWIYFIFPIPGPMNLLLLVDLVVGVGASARTISNRGAANRVVGTLGVLWFGSLIVLGVLLHL